MQKRVVLHIGPHKTATSHLQKSFLDSHALLEAHRVRYPAAWRSGHGHHVLASTLKKSGEHRQGVASEIAAHLNQATDVLLLSSENLSYLNQPDVAFLAPLASAAQVEVIYFQRRWSDLVYSSWQEEVKHGSRQTLPEYWLGHVSAPFASRVLNPDVILKPWLMTFGAEAIRVLNYDAIEASGMDIFATFLTKVLHLAEAPNGTTEPGARTNRSVSAAHTELLRVLNVLDDGAGTRQQQRARALGRFRGLATVDADALTEILDELDAHTEMLHLDESSS